MRAFIGIFLALVAHAEPRGDASLHEQRTCILETVAFADEQHGWLSDRCGSVYESKDAGTSWQKVVTPPRGMFTGENRALSHFVWFTPKEGLAFVENAAQAYRTTDAGATWSSVLMPLRQVFDEVEATEHHVWACGPEGCVRSLDAGRSWQTLATPFTKEHPCHSLSFSDGRNGWATGRGGVYYETDDAGDTWRERKSPMTTQARAVRMTRSLGWLASDNTLFRTVDGGEHFELIDANVTSADKLFVHRTSGKTYFSSNETGKQSDLRIVVTSSSPWGEDGAVGTTGDLIYFYRGRELVRASPPLARVGKSISESIQVVAERAEPVLVPGWQTTAAMRGWSTRHSFESRDQGKSWFVLSDMPKGTRRVAPTGPFAMVADTTAGWQRSDDAGRSWAASTNPDWDAYEFAVATKASATNPMACLATATNAAIDVEIRMSNDGGGSTGSLSIRRVGQSVTLAGKDDAHRAAPAAVNASPSVETFSAAASRLVAVVARGESPPGCMSTSSATAHVAWSCGGPTRSLDLAAFDCGPDRGPAEGVESGPIQPDSYARALAVRSWVRELLRGGATSPLSR